MENIKDTNLHPHVGIPVDKYGGATIDPTKNVLDLVEAAIRRVDDLRMAETRRIDEIIAAEVLRAAQLRTEDSKRTEDMAELRAAHSTEILRLTTSHSKELMEAEAKRIDAIRIIDVAAVSTANDKATFSYTGCFFCRCATNPCCLYCNDNSNSITATYSTINR